MGFLAGREAWRWSFPLPVLHLTEKPSMGPSNIHKTTRGCAHSPVCEARLQVLFLLADRAGGQREKDFIIQARISSTSGGTAFW